MDKFITLKKAVDVYKSQDRAPVNSYNWYRDDAFRRKKVSFNDYDVEARKIGNTWYVLDESFNKAIAHHKAVILKIEQNTLDYQNGIFHKSKGRSVETLWGSYEVKGDFRLVDRWAKKDSYGVWYCNKCNKPAQLEHNNEECHLCSDWNGCGKDCKLSRVFCVNCSTSLKI